MNKSIITNNKSATVTGVAVDGDDDDDDSIR